MRRSFAAVVVSWLVVVAIGSALVWAVISRVGDGLGTTAGSPLAPSSSPSSSVSVRAETGRDPSISTQVSMTPFLFLSYVLSASFPVFGS